MRPFDIQNRSFLVGLRGYDKDEVRSFLAEVASEHAEVLAELEALRSDDQPSPASVDRDDFDGVGASVAAILRAAKVSAAEVTTQAEDLRDRAVAEADSIRAQASDEAERIIRDATERAAQLEAETSGRLDGRIEDAERIVREATERAAQIDAEASALFDGRFDEVSRREAATKARLLEAGDELHRALVALGEVDLREPALGSSDAVSLDSPH
jgi:cell division initiation protein